MCLPIVSFDTTQMKTMTGFHSTSSTSTLFQVGLGGPDTRVVGHVVMRGKHLQLCPVCGKCWTTIGVPPSIKLYVVQCTVRWFGFLVWGLLTDIFSYNGIFDLHVYIFFSISSMHQAF